MLIQRYNCFVVKSCKRYKYITNENLKTLLHARNHITISNFD